MRSGISRRLNGTRGNHIPNRNAFQGMGSGYLGIPVVSKSAAFTLDYSYAGKLVLHPATDGNSRIFTVPGNETCAFEIGTAISFANESANDIDIILTTDAFVLFDGSAVTSGFDLTITTGGMATIIKIEKTKWMVTGIGITIS